MKILRLTVVLLLILTVRSAAAERILLDEVVASVNDTAITRSQIEQEARFILVQEGYHWSGPLTPALLEKVLVRHIAKLLIYRELEKRRARGGAENAPRDSSEELAELLRDFRARFKSDEHYRLFLRLTQMSEEALTAQIWRNHRIEQFMQKRLETFSQPTQAEIDEEMNKRLKKISITENELAQLRALVQRELSSRKYKEALEKWLEELRGRARILQIVHFDRAGGTQGSDQ